MKGILILLVILIISIGSYAQYDESKAKEIISNSLQKYKDYEDFKMSFKLVIEDKMSEDKFVNEGSIWLKGEKYRIDVQDQIIATDLDKIWVYLKEANEVQLNEYVSEEQEINPTIFFNFWEKGYLYGYVGDVKIKSTIYHLIELTPEKKEISFYKIKVYINPESNELSIVKVYNRSGTILTFGLYNLEPNNGVTDDFFIFNSSDFPEADIIDLTE